MDTKTIITGTGSSSGPRRTLATRNTSWAKMLARGMAQAGIRPNAVSIASVVFASWAAMAFCAVPAARGGSRAALLIVAAAAIQLRLLCNLLDGMLALEHGMKGKTGDIYNDLPDRLADVLILVAAGYSVRDLQFGIGLGWAAAVLAVFTAYVRLLAGSLGLKQHFIGPMAKQHRMFTLTVAALLSSVETLAGMRPHAMRLGLLVIVLGSILTVVRRARRLLHEAEAR
jgi:phosphatidylglycerophosphate synthase